MKNNTRMKCRRPAQKQFPIKRYEFTIFSVLLAATLLIGLAFPVTAHSQLSFLKLGKDQSAYGFGIQFMEDSRRISGVLEFGINSGTKVYGAGGIGFVDDDSVDYRPGVEIPPSPSIGLGILYMNPLQQTGFDTFLTIEGSASFAKEVVGAETRESARALGLAGMGGLLKRIETESGMKLTPYFGISYTHIWTTVTDKRRDFDESEDEGSTGAQIGMEIHLSSTVIAHGAFSFSFDHSDTTFGVGLTFR